MTDHLTLSQIRRTLLNHHGPPSIPEFEDPFHWILWEQVAYLASDEKRLAAFQLLSERVGLTPQTILSASLDLLTKIAMTGGSIAAEKRAQRMQDSARRVLDEWGGKLERVLELPVGEALRSLLKFPMIGKPGAEKILLLTGSKPLLALDSNGLRVLLRLGYGQEDSRYDKSYRSVRAATAAEERLDCDWLATLHGLLRIHGQTLCRTNRPQCGECPLSRSCAYTRTSAQRSSTSNRQESGS